MMKRLRDWFRGDVLEITSVDFETGAVSHSPGRVRVSPIFAWYDIWIGVFINTDPCKRAVYIFPVPMLGIKVYWGD
jgi:hypothetical protein